MIFLGCLKISWTDPPVCVCAKCPPWERIYKMSQKDLLSFDCVYVHKPLKRFSKSSSYSIAERLNCSYLRMLDEVLRRCFYVTEKIDKGQVGNSGGYSHCKTMSDSIISTFLRHRRHKHPLLFKIGHFFLEFTHEP